MSQATSPFSLKNDSKNPWGAKIIKEPAFSWQGLPAVLDALKPAGVPVPQQVDLESNSAKLREQGFCLLMGELEYD